MKRCDGMSLLGFEGKGSTLALELAFESEFLVCAEVKLALISLQITEIEFLVFKTHLFYKSSQGRCCFSTGP
jgi:hypothetical protein